MQMADRVSILITGASGGIGRAAAIECARRGARIGVHYNANRERAEATLEQLHGDGHHISQRHRFEDIDYATWQRTWQRIVTTNLTAASNLCFCAGKKMIARGGGRIVNVSSRGAFRGEPLMPWYGASKAGMNAMGQSLAQALGPQGVFVYTVAPGFVETEMAAAVLASPEGDSIRNQSTIGRVAQPEELGKTICFLALDAPEFMTGCIVDVNGASYLRS
jgi:NAD(P)-dependent dehydrogenase (short-subunit alcohol dehydrogenase family)